MNTKEEIIQFLEKQGHQLDVLDTDYIKGANSGIKFYWKGKGKHDRLLTGIVFYNSIYVHTRYLDSNHNVCILTIPFISAYTYLDMCE